MFDQLAAMAVFVRVVEAGGFSAAARELGLSKSAVSKSVARLEDRLGLRLLNRTTRKLSLTEAGAAYHAGCRRMLAEAEAAERAVVLLAGAPRGTLKVNAPMSFGVARIAPLLPDFLRRYPEVELDMVFEDRATDLVEQGYDLAVRIGALPDSSLVARRLCPVRRLLVAAPDYLATRGTPARPEALAAHDCLLYHYLPSGDLWRFQGPEGEERSVKVSGRARLNNGEALLTACIAGLGVALMPSFLCAEALRDGRLRRLLPDWRDPAELAVHAVFPATRNLSPKVRAFVDHLAAAFAPGPPWDEGLEP